MGFAIALPILQIGFMADYDAFISYSHAQDKPVAAALKGQFSAEPKWVDVRERP
jgi:hypothetical protein